MRNDGTKRDLENIKGAYRALHFVRFDDNYSPQFWDAVKAFGRPDFMHRKWDRRARREIADGDIVVFAKGDENQPVSKFNGDDEFYSHPPGSGRVGL